MKNKPYNTEDGVVWQHRSIAVAGMVFANEDGEWYVLANKRGEGTPDFQGCWNMPCGYLDYDETLIQAVAREVYEESGVQIDPELFIFDTYHDDPINSNKQNVTARFYCVLPSRKSLSTSPLTGEDNEVEVVSWIDVDDVDDFDWAFNHNNIIKDILNKIK